MPAFRATSWSRRIRAVEAGAHNSDLPVVAMSAHAMDEVVRPCRQEGMTGYIDKPIDADNLARVLQDVTHGASGFGNAMATDSAG